MKFKIEIKDERDERKDEPWSFFGVSYDRKTLIFQLSELADYLVKYPEISEVKIERFKN